MSQQYEPVEGSHHSIKVLHLIDSGGLYGAEKMLLTLVEEQIKQGLESVILSAGEKGIEDKAIEMEARRLGLPVEPWRMAPGFNLKEAWRVLTWAKHNEFNVIHSHGYKFNILMGALPRKLRRIPLVATLHGYVNAKRYTKMWLYEVLDRIILKRLDKVCVVSPHMKGLQVIKSLSPNQLEVIENGLPALEGNTNVTLAEEITTFTDAHSFNLLTVGRLSPEKNFGSLIQALSCDLLQNEGIGLCIVGEGRLRESLEQQRDALGLKDHIKFLGYRSDVVELMKAFDLLVMPSLTEGLPITLLEAMREGLPILASEVGGLPSALEYGFAGRLFNVHDLGEMESQLIDMAKNKLERDELSVRAKARFQKFYSSSVMTSSYYDVYKSLAVDSSLGFWSSKV